MPRLSDEQLEERSRGLGASDVATVAGVNPFQTPLELYLTKIGELDPDAMIDDAARGRMERGHRLEDVALEWDRDLTGDPFYRVTRTVWHPTLPFLYCHPDATRDPFGKLNHLIEVKTSSRSWKEIPQHVEIQVHAQMAVTGASIVDILLLTFDGAPTRYTIERDAQMVAAIEKMAAAFWDRVERRDPPPMDGSDGATRWLDSTRWRNEPEQQATDVQRRLLRELIELRDEIARGESMRDELENKLKLTMAGSSRLVADGIGKVVWTAPTKTRTTKWKEVAGDLMILVPDERARDELIDKWTIERESRAFRVTPFARED